MPHSLGFMSKSLDFFIVWIYEKSNLHIKKAAEIQYLKAFIAKENTDFTTNLLLLKKP